MKRMIFVCGLHRSGTSLLENFLFSKFEVCALRANVPENEGQFLQDVYKPAFKYGGPGRFAFSKKMQDDINSLTDYLDCQSRISNSWKQHTVGTGDFLVEKSPPNLTKIWWLRKVFPGALFIIWTRDPRAVACATRKWCQTSLEELMMHWSTAYKIGKNDIKASDCILMSYEDFCESPDRCFEKSGLLEYLTKRNVPLPLESRFLEVRNSNSEYLKYFDGKLILGGSWEHFGYSLRCDQSP